MKLLVVYQSKTGFTEKYAQWIAKELRCEAKRVKTVTEQDIASSDIVIHGGWILGGMINGLEKVRKMSPRQLVVFGVGSMEEGREEENIIALNHLEETPFFYMRGGMDPKKMGFFQRMTVKAVTKQAVQYEDHTDKKYIAKLIEYCRKKTE